jgi:hypothetical protein
MWGALSDEGSDLYFSVFVSIASAIFLGPESLGTHVPILLFQVVETPSIRRDRFLYLFI